MSRISRRKFFTWLPVITTISGCSSRNNTETTTSTHYNEAYFSSVLANPDEEDDSNSNSEFLVIETERDTSLDLRNHTLDYGPGFEFTLPDRLDDVSGGSSLIFFSESKESVSNSDTGHDYVIYINNDEPLLNSGGMELTLRDEHGYIVDQIEYNSMSPGEMWINNE